MKTTKTITTQLKTYRFDISIDKQKEQYQSLVNELMRSQPREPMPGLVQCGQGHEFAKRGDDLEIDLELTHLFNNQWNSAPIEMSKNGYRLFDWAENIYPNKSIKEGYYLVQTEEMKEVRRNTSGCGYCGKQEPSAKGLVFCDKCIGSEYLKETELHLLRMMPIYRSNETRRELSEAEKAHLMPLYIDAQIHGSTERDKAARRKEREAVDEKRRKAINNAENEYLGMTYLLNCGYRLSNVIYYDHKQRFNFGWRKPIGPEEWSRLADILAEFPCDYDVQTSFDGVKSSG